MHYLYNQTSSFLAPRWDVVTGAVRFLYFNSVCWLTGDHLPNFQKVSEQFYRGGQPDIDGMQLLASKGVKQLICLRVVDKNTPLIEQANVQMTTHLIAFDVDHFNETEATQAAESLLTLVKDGKSSFLHCYYGCERTGVLAAVYRMVVMKATRKQVIQDLEKDPNFHKERHPELIPFLQNLDIDRLKGVYEH